MDSFAGSEPREFIPFYLGKESNGQPNQSSTEDHNTGGATEIACDNVAKQTSSSALEGGSSDPLQQTSGLQLSDLLPTAIEIIEETSSHVSAAHESGGDLSPASVPAMDSKFQGLTSPDYSPSLLKFLGTDNSSSGESVQTYITRKLGTQNEEIGEPGPSSRRTRESESNSIALTPALNLLLEPSGCNLPEPIVTFLGPLPALEQSTENGQLRNAAKRPRVGSSSNFYVQPPPKFGPLTADITSQDPFGLHTSQETQAQTSRQTKAFSGSEYELETDAESVNYPDGSTIAQAIDSKNSHLDLSDGSVSTDATVPQSTPHNPVLRPSGRALMKELFSTAEMFNLAKGHPVIAFTEEQISGVLKVVAEETARSTQEMMERLIKQTSEMNLGPSGSQTPASPRLSELGKRRNRSVGSSRYSETSGALQSDDDFSSIGYSFEAKTMLESPTLPAQKKKPAVVDIAKGPN